nr:hypothetical protein [Tanacetum cinerariifolium]
MGYVKKYVAERAHHQRQYERRVNNKQMQMQKSKIDLGSALDVVSSQALDADLVVMESNGTESGMHDTNSSSGNYITHVDSNTSPGSTNMSHMGGEINHDAEHDQVKSPLLKAEFLKMKDMVEKEVHNELSNRFLQLEKHCFSLEISIQQKEESFQTNKPCKNQDSLEFHEFFEINELKAQLQAKNSTINNSKKQIKHECVKSNEAKTYKELFDLRIHTKDHNDSLIAQVNSKTVENANLKAQIQENIFANAALKNELRKLKGTCVDTMFAKPSILGKLVLQPHRNQLGVRQPTAFKSERCKFSKPQFASQVDVINDLLKSVTPHYVPKVRESMFVKPHHVIASGSSRNSSNESYRSNGMAHKYYLDVAKKKTQDKNMSLKPSVRHTTSLQNTTNDSKPKPRRNNQTSRSFLVPKSSCGMSNGVPLVAHSKNSSSFSDSKHFICSTCHKCVFNANHDDCITKFLKRVNSRAKVQSPKTRNINKPVEPKSHTQKPDRQIAIGQRFSLNKSSVVREKPNTPRSCLRWIPTGRILKTAGLRWIPTGNMFIDSTTKVDSEPSNGSNKDITNPYECKQSLDVSAVQASDLNVNKMASADNTLVPTLQRKERCTLQCALSLEEEKSSCLRPFSSTSFMLFHARSVIKWINVPLIVVLFTCSIKNGNLISVATSRAVDLAGSPSSTTINQDVPSTSSSPTTQEIQSQVTHQDPSSEETTLQGFIPSNFHHLNQSFDTLTKLTMNHSVENVICDPSRSILTRSQLQGHAIWCYFDANDNPIPLVGNGVVEIYYLKGRIMVDCRFGERLLKLLKEEEDCLTTKFNYFPKVQVKDLVIFQIFPMSQRTILVTQAAYFFNLIMKFKMSPMMSLTLSSAKLEIQSMVDVPIHQEDPAVQRTLLIDTIISMVTDKTTSTPTPPTTQAHFQICSTSCWKYISRGV